MRALTLALAAAVAAALVLGGAGCLSHMPPAGHRHMQIAWRASWDAALADAQREQKPILACLVAGEIDGLC